MQLFEVAAQVFEHPECMQPPQAVLVRRSAFLPGQPAAINVVGPSVREVPLEIKCGRIICPLYVVAAQTLPGYINFVNPSMSEVTPIPPM